MGKISKCEQYLVFDVDNLMGLNMAKVGNLFPKIDMGHLANDKLRYVSNVRL